MQAVTRAWEETNRSLFTREANIIITFDRADGKQPFITDTDIISFSYIKNGDIFSSAITQDKISFTANNRDGILDYDESGNNDVYQNTQVIVSDGFKNVAGDAYDAIDGGVYYITSVNKDSDNRRYTFTAQTILGFMTEKRDTELNVSNAYALAVQVIEQAKNSKAVPESQIRLVCDVDYLRSITINMGTDELSLASCLQLVAAAAGCILYVDRLGAVHIEKIGTVSQHYVLAKKFLYNPLTIEYAERIGNVTIISNHGAMSDGTDIEGDKIGGTQIVTIPILDDESQSHDIVFQTLAQLQNGRKRFKAKCRFDPAVDLFDIVVVPNGTAVDTAIITGINATYSGAWKADLTLMSVTGIVLDLRICDIELLTIAQFEGLHINDIGGAE